MAWLGPKRGQVSGPDNMSGVIGLEQNTSLLGGGITIHSRRRFDSISFIVVPWQLG
jgi:hypothetical protein